MENFSHVIFRYCRISYRQQTPTPFSQPFVNSKSSLDLISSNECHVVVAHQRAGAQREQAKQAQALRQQAEAQPWPGAQLKFNRRNGTLTAQKDGKSANALSPNGEALLNTLPAEIQNKVKTNQYVRVTAYVADGVLVRVEAP